MWSGCVARDLEAARIACRKWRANNPDTAKAASRKGDKRWRANNPVKSLYRGLVSSSRKRGHILLLTLDQLTELVAPMRCAMTDRSLIWGAGDWAPSIDRIDNSKGYELGNVRLVAWIINRARNDGTDEALLDMARALVAKHG
jgi:hypothetical protein